MTNLIVRHSTFRLRSNNPRRIPGQTLYQLNFTMAFVSAVAPALSTSRTSLRCTARPVATSGFRGSRVTVPAPAARVAVRMSYEISEGVSYKVNPLLVLGLALAGWIIPSSIPAPIALTGGAGLSQAFFSSISSNLANWPAGPASADPFWTLCFMWHAGLFGCVSAWLSLAAR
jgi:photosystem I protein PsaO